MGGKKHATAQPKPVAKQVAELGAKFTAEFEGYSSEPYQDSGGTWTIGYGSTRDIHGDPITADTPPITHAIADALLARDLDAAVQEVRTAVGVTLTQNEWVALADFVYNEGIGHFTKSTALRLLNEGRYAEAAKALEEWDIAGGHVLAGLLRRRIAEETLFDTPNSTPA